MNKKQLSKLSFDTALDFMVESGYPIASRDDLERYSIDMITRGCYHTAISVLEALTNGYADYFVYSYSGEEPEPLETIEDLVEIF